MDDLHRDKLIHRPTTQRQGMTRTNYTEIGRERDELLIYTEIKQLPVIVLSQNDQA